jgi:hypothetical protein
LVDQSEVVVDHPCLLHCRLDVRNDNSGLAGAPCVVDDE